MLILTAALVMSVLGLIFGALLGVTGRVFKVPANEKAEALRECLPGANCGACGYPGCDGYAAAVADGKAEVGACAVGGPACAAKMGEIMGVSVNACLLYTSCYLLKTGFDVNATLAQLLSGGLILGAFFMATDYSSSPATAKGKIVFGIGCGLLLFIFRACKKTPAEWCSYAILLMNVCSPLIERVTGNKSFGEVKKE